MQLVAVMFFVNLLCSFTVERNPSKSIVAFWHVLVDSFPAIQYRHLKCIINNIYIHYFLFIYFSFKYVTAYVFRMLILCFLDAVFLLTMMSYLKYEQLYLKLDWIHIRNTAFVYIYIHILACFIYPNIIILLLLISITILLLYLQPFTFGCPFRNLNLIFVTLKV